MHMSKTKVSKGEYYDEYKHLTTNPLIYDCPFSNSCPENCLTCIQWGLEDEDVKGEQHEAN